MNPIPFFGEPARILWDHIKDHLELLEEAKGLLQQGSSQQRQRGVALMVAFMVTAAWGYRRSIRRKHIRRDDGWECVYDTLEGRFEYLAGLNPDIYRLCPSRVPVLLEIHLEGATEPLVIEVGEWVGFTAVLPLTRRGYEAYMIGGVPISELIEDHIVRAPYQPHTVDVVALTGLMHWRALPEYLNPGNPKNLFPRPARALLEILVRQIAKFLTTPQVYKDQDGAIFSKSEPNRLHPVLFSPLSGNGMGEDLLATAGFRPIPGRDQRKNEVWELDFRDFDSDRCDVQRLREIYRAWKLTRQFTPET